MQLPYTFTEKVQTKHLCDCHRSCNSIQRHPTKLNVKISIFNFLSVISGSCNQTFLLLYLMGNKRNSVLYFFRKFAKNLNILKCKVGD